MTLSMHELFLIYRGLRDAFPLWEMMSVFIARHVVVRLHGVDGWDCFPTESLCSRQLSCHTPEIEAPVKAYMRLVTVTVANGRWLLLENAGRWKLGKSHLYVLYLTRTLESIAFAGRRQKLREVPTLFQGHPVSKYQHWYLSLFCQLLTHSLLVSRCCALVRVPTQDPGSHWKLKGWILRWVSIGISDFLLR